MMNYLKKLMDREEKKLVCFGTGLVGEKFQQLCEKNQITISYFCDNDEKKWGTTLGGTTICSLEEVLEKEEKEQFIVVISNMRNRDEIETQLENQGIERILPVDLAFAEGSNKRTSYFAYQEKDYKDRAMRRKNPDVLLLEKGSTAVIGITKKCTLNCNYCVAAVPYLKHKESITMEEFKNRIDYMLTFFDALPMFNITGGECTVHPDFYEMIDYASAKEEVFLLRIYSNGTTSLKREKLLPLVGRNILFCFTRYGEYSTKIESNVALLEELGIQSDVLVHGTWLNTFVLPTTGGVVENVKEHYENCIQGKCNSFTGKHFSKCGLIPRLSYNQLLPEEQLDWVDLDLEKRSLEEIKEDIRQYSKKEYLETCKHCTGFDVNQAENVPVGEQVVGVIPYPDGREWKNQPILW